MARGIGCAWGGLAWERISPRIFYFHRRRVRLSVQAVNVDRCISGGLCRRYGALLLLALVGWFGGGAMPAAAAAATAPGLTSKAAAGTPAPAKLPGVTAAEAVSQVTGMAISPALGVGAVGAWRYFHTPAEQRGALAWWSQPWFWVPALGLVLLVFAKDAAGPVLPTVLKKPCDVAELFENKFSALLATGAVIPLAWSISRSLAPDGGSAMAGTGVAAIDFSPLVGLLTVPVALAAYVAVFLVSHVIQVLILISPFGTVDAALKAFRLFLLSTVAGTSLASPNLGALWSGLIILACLPLAGWAFRFLTFGQIFAWDIATFHRLRRVPEATDNRAFLTMKLGGAPRRTYGWLTRNDAGQLVFRYRPWLVLAVRSVTLPAGQYAIGRGFIHPELLQLDMPPGSGKAVDLLDFPPRYKGHEKLLGQAYGVTEIHEVGLRAMWSWVRRSLTGAGPEIERISVST